MHTHTDTLKFLKEFLEKNFLSNIDTTKNIRTRLVKEVDYLELEKFIIASDLFLKCEDISEEDKNLIINNCCLGHVINEKNSKLAL
ncbi:TPA: hypothetical protein ACY4R7_002610 [Clostridium perfringens]|nr:hypothetical protein [Clostridium perfringens]